MANKVIYFHCFFFHVTNTTGDVKGMEALISLSENVEPVIGHQDSTFYVEQFIDEVIDYHNSLDNEKPTKYVVFFFYETNNITVVRKTVDLLKRKENEVSGADSINGGNSINNKKIQIEHISI